MKISLAVFMTGILLLTSLRGCQKFGDNDAVSDVVITGYDVRDCICCGGLMVNFDNDPIPYSGTFSLVEDLPVDTLINSKTKFPLYVRITWRYSTKDCAGTQFIDVLKIEPR